MTFGTVIADPPWMYADKMLKMKGTGNGAAAQYACLSELEIAQFLWMNDIQVADDAHLWLWATNAFIEPAHAIARAWGFKPITVVTWVKGKLVVDVDRFGITTPRLVHHICQGRYLRNSTEHCLFAVRGRGRPHERNLPTAFIYPGRWPGRRHSEKPQVIHEWAERISPKPRIELFARRRRPGWAAKGHEVAA